MDHADFESRLRTAHNKQAPKPRQIKLPTPNHIHVSGDTSSVTIHLSATAVLANMQDDAAAFEGWALALMSWCDVARIGIDWNEPDTNALAADPGHYQRFLYRARRFAALLGPGRIEICQPDRLDQLRVGRGKQAVLNVASQCRVSPYGDAPLDWRTLSENQLECWLTAPNSPARQRLVAALRLHKLDRQFPVGVFASSVLRSNAVFTGGSSAIDILGIDECRTLWLLELKARSNGKVGALSELLLYSNVMHDVLTDREHWRFHVPAQPIKSDIGPAEILGCDRVEARLLTPPVHPLLDQATTSGRKVFEMLNEGSARLGWNIGFGTLDVRPFLDAHDEPSRAVSPAGATRQKEHTA
ncbi:hypothetical protein [Falsiroseomonas sp. E2-1-a20]|uniref:hypothetical protein n=1 Tax=Falsiroseomonas sp. E2-1-a20 TaxID=3239300 RepID=UPI003F2B3E85